MSLGRDNDAKLIVGRYSTWIRLGQSWRFHRFTTIITDTSYRDALHHDNDANRRMVYFLRRAFCLTIYYLLVALLIEHILEAISFRTLPVSLEHSIHTNCLNILIVIQFIIFFAACLPARLNIDLQIT